MTTKEILEQEIENVDTIIHYGVIIPIVKIESVSDEYLCTWVKLGQETKDTRKVYLKTDGITAITTKLRLTLN